MVAMETLQTKQRILKRIRQHSSIHTSELYSAAQAQLCGRLYTSACIPANLHNCLPACLHTWLLLYLLVCTFACQYECVRARMPLLHSLLDHLLHSGYTPAIAVTSLYFRLSRLVSRLPF
jgi:hypothetical protein